MMRILIGATILGCSLIIFGLHTLFKMKDEDKQ